MIRYTSGNTIHLIEGTTKTARFHIFAPIGGKEIDLTNFVAKAYIDRPRGRKVDIVKSCKIEGNVVSFRIEPKDTINCSHLIFEIRLTDGAEVYAIKGNIVVEKSLINFSTVSNFVPNHTKEGVYAVVDEDRQNVEFVFNNGGNLSIDNENIEIIEEGDDNIE